MHLDMEHSVLARQLRRVRRGERDTDVPLLARGRPGQPDYIEKPGTTLDFVLRKNFKDFFGWNWFKPSLKLTGRNLLGTDHEEFMARDGDRVDIYTYSPGSSWNLSFSIDF